MSRALPYLALATAIFCTAGTARAESPHEIAIPATLAAHPRFFRDRPDLSTDPLYARYRDVLLKTAEDMLGTPVATHTLTGYRMLDESRSALARITVCAEAWRITGDTRFHDRALKELRTVCAFPDWNPQHFLDTAEMAFGVAVGYDRLYPTLTPEDRKLIAGALVSNALRPGLKVYASKNGWHTRDNNWNQVCNGGLIVAALAVADTEPALAKQILGSAVASLPRAVRQYHPDGGYQEGPNYWEYGTSFNVFAIALMRETLGTDAGLADDPAFRATAGYYARMRGPTGLFFNYADCPETAGPTPAYAWLAREFGPDFVRADARAELENHLRNFRFETHECGRLLAFYSAMFPVAPKRAETSPPDAHFRGRADIVTMRSSWSGKDAAYVGFKAGKNDTPHADLDLGSFVFDALGERWILDPGADFYDLPGYWDGTGGRWKIFRLNNFSHATLSPENALQDFRGTGEITRLDSETGRAETAANLDRAIPTHFTAWTRTITLDRTSSALTVHDDVAVKTPGETLVWNAPTRATVTIDAADPRSATLTLGGKKLRARIESPADFVFEAVPFPATTPPARPVDGLTLLHAKGKATAATMKIVVTLTPVK